MRFVFRTRWFCTPLWFRYEVWICHMISMKILFHVWNLILFKGQKYHQGSLAYFFCIVKRQSITVLSSVLLFFVWPVTWPVACDLWPVTWPVACNLTCDLTCGLWPVTCDLHFSPAAHMTYTTFIFVKVFWIRTNTVNVRGKNSIKLFALCFYFNELSIYKWTEPWNIKGRFPESWGLRASVSSSPPPLPFQPFFFASALTFAQ